MSRLSSKRAREIAATAVALCAICCSSGDKSKPANVEPTRSSAVPFTPAPDEWDFYPTQMNGRPAMVMVNFWFNSRAPLAGFDQLLWVVIKMEHPDEHGLGDDTENSASGPLEDALFAEVQTKVHAHYVGRVRNDGEWRLYFYGQGSKGFDDAVNAFMKRYPSRTYTLGHKDDAGWTFFKTVLQPDEERMAWIGDNSVVENLKSHGDLLTEARRVDHWIYFRDETSSKRFEAAVVSRGFAIERNGPVKNETGSIGVQVYRTDFADVERIHAVVMELRKLAAEHGGEYDGWETFILRPGAAKP